MSASTRRVLLLGATVILIGSSSSSSLLHRPNSGNVAYAQSVTVQQAPSSAPASESAAHAEINIGHGKTERDVEDGQVVSAEVQTERRPLIAVPILVQVGPQGEIVESTAAGGGVRFELDHQVPPPSFEQEGARSSGSNNVRRADPMADQPMVPTEAAAVEALALVPEEGGALNGAKHRVAAAHPTQDEAPLTNLAEPAAAASLDSESKAEMNRNLALETTPSIQPIAEIETHAELNPENKEAVQAAFQEPELQTTQPEKATAEPPIIAPATNASEKVDRKPPIPLTPEIDLTLQDTDPNIHAILDTSAEEFGSPYILHPTFAAAISLKDSEANRPVKAEAEVEEQKKKEEATAADAQAAADSEVIAKVRFDQYRAKIEAELESYRSKVSPNDGQDVFEIGNLSPIAPPAVDSALEQPPPSVAVDEKNQEERVDGKVVVSTEGKLVKVNKLNKNHDGFEGSQGTNSVNDVDSRPQVSLHHHHHHVSGGSRKQQQRQQQQEQKQESSDNNKNIIVANDDGALVFGSPVLGTTPVIHKELGQIDNDDDSNEGEDDIDDNDVETVAHPPPPSFPPTAVPPEELRNRGLVPSVKGGYHCTPQFCVNVSLTDDGQFATFHIERSMDETGWISLGIGYAMTTADLLIMWPNKDPASGGGPRGATLSRRTSHAYVEPQLVSREEAEIKASGKGESLYPENEYILHNPYKNHNSGDVSAAMTAATQVFPTEANRFIVQFTRPVRTQNRAHKLTPGKEQDFCWAYSPNPISADSVADPGAHITQHMSVGSFAMDVGANQPQLKDAILKQQEMDAKEAVIEKERKKWTLEESNRRLEEDERERTKGEKHKVSAKHKADGGSASKAETSDASSRSWLRAVGYGGGSSSSVIALQGFSCLVAMAFMWFFR
ncbi:hypothetical protein BKA57DRAFT_491258 [Linnemannia elongata]|nr:hypothetical protein BKA57DRAFT_491258 [Linnemannia elongata]